MTRIAALALALPAVLAAAAAAQPSVSHIAPAPQQVNAPANGDIVIRFDTALDLSTVNPGTIRVFGRWSGPAAGTLSTEASATQVRFTPDAPFFAGEWVTVSVSTGIRDTWGVAMAAPFTSNHWIRTSGGTLDQTYLGRVAIRQSREGWIQSYGAYAGDLNNDGWSDLSIPNEIPGDLRVFLNDGAGGYSGFVIHALPDGDTPSANEGADFNHDGQIDLVVANGGNDKVSLMTGDGAGGFGAGTSFTAAAVIKGIAVLDLNGDGWDDFVSANRVGNNISLFLNDGSGGFPAVGTPLETGGNAEFSIAAADADNDGIQDVFVGAFNSNEIRLLLGDGNGGLVFSAATPIGGRPWMLAVGDVNDDGNVDVVAANSYMNNAGVALGDGAGGFISYTNYATGAFPLAIDLGDLDGDGDLDLVTSNYSTANWTVLENVGGSFMNPRTYNASSAGSCAILHDRDNDGDLDFTGIDELDDWIYLFDNELPPTGTGPPPPARVVLNPARPNPTGAGTRLQFELPRSMYVTLDVYDVAGRRVARVLRETRPAGRNEVQWDPGEAGRLASGVYHIRLSTPDGSYSRKLTVLR